MKLAEKAFYIMVFGLGLLTFSAFMLWEPVGWLVLLVIGLLCAVGGAITIAES